MKRYRVVTSVGNERVGRVVGAQGNYYLVRRSFSRETYPLPKEHTAVFPEKKAVVMYIPRRDLFAAPRVKRGGEIDPATEHHYNG